MESRLESRLGLGLKASACGTGGGLDGRGGDSWTLDKSPQRAQRQRRDKRWHSCVVIRSERYWGREINVWRGIAGDEFTRDLVAGVVRLGRRGSWGLL